MNKRKNLFSTPSLSLFMSHACKRFRMKNLKYKKFYFFLWVREIIKEKSLAILIARRFDEREN
jgi:hypothetical protein